MGAVAKNLGYKQKRDNRRSMVAGVYTLACVILFFFPNFYLFDCYFFLGGGGGDFFLFLYPPEVIL